MTMDTKVQKKVFYNLNKMYEMWEAVPSFSACYNDWNISKDLSPNELT
jgi:hypothetical protein